MDLPQNGIQANFLVGSIKELKEAQEHINDIKNLTQSANAGGADIEPEDVKNWLEDLECRVMWAIQDAEERLGLYEEAA